MAKGDVRAHPMRLGRTLGVRALLRRDQFCILFSLMASVDRLCANASAKQLRRLVLDDHGAVCYIGEFRGLALCFEGTLKLEWRPRNGWFAQACSSAFSNS